MRIERVPERGIPFVAVMLAAGICVEIMPDHGSTELAEFPTPAQRSIGQAIGRCCQKLVCPAIEGMQGGQWRGKSIMAVASQFFPTKLEGVWVTVFECPGSVYRLPKSALKLIKSE